MRLTVRFLGLDLLDVYISTNPDPELLDDAAALSGGTTASYPISVLGVYGDLEPEPWSDYEE